MKSDIARPDPIMHIMHNLHICAERYMQSAF